MLQGYIVDPETGKVVAVIRHGEVFCQDEEGAKIATVVNGNLYDLSGKFVGRLDGPHAIDVRTWSMPIAMRNFLKMTPRVMPFPLSQGNARTDPGFRADARGAFSGLDANSGARPPRGGS